MELKDFIKETLVNIVEGVNQGNEHFKNSTSDDYSKQIDRFVLSSGAIPSDRSMKSAQGAFVDFNISVQAVEKKGAKSKGSIGVVLASLGSSVSGSKSSENENSATHKLSFKVFVKKDVYQ
jgi:thioredoxin reductase